MDAYRARADEPVAVLNAAIQELVQNGAPGGTPAAGKRAARPVSDTPAFVPAQRFGGFRRGYFFGTGDNGTGCALYLDAVLFH